MAKKLFFLLHLHLLTPQQLLFLLCFITIMNSIIMLIYLWKKNYFVEAFDFIILAYMIVFIAYLLFWGDHVTFFLTLIYLHLFLVAVYFIIKRYRFQEDDEDDKDDD